MSQSLIKTLKEIQNAVNYEIDEHYINATGKSSTFSNFIIKKTKELSSLLKDKDDLKRLINILYAYPTQDISARIQSIHKTQEILKAISDKNKEALKEEKVLKAVKSKKRELPFETNIKKTDVKYVKGVGPKLSLVLNRLGIFTVHDLLTYYPRSYIDYEKKSKIKDLRINENVVIVGKVKSIQFFNPPKKKTISVLTIKIADETGKISITKFTSRKFGRAILKQYKTSYPEDSEVFCSGTVNYDKFSKSFSLENANIELIDKNGNSDPTESVKIVPIYPLTEGISQETLKKIIINALEIYSEKVEESLPQQILKDEGLLDLRTTINQIHFPTNNQLCTIARNRIIFEEFFLMQLQLGIKRLISEKGKKGLSLKEKEGSLVEKLKENLPFKLTSAQLKAFDEIKGDLMGDQPMHRLLQGDVGSGKTIVALMALLFAIDNGYQGALMAPTEILTHQHAIKLQQYLSKLGIQVVELTGSTPTKMKREIYEGLATGLIKIVVGTHALIQNEVSFANLGLAVIDEQHRFGVKQRDDLLKKGKNVERLFMTATPIPRTLALAVHGDLNLSEIDELPPGRIPIKTSIVQPSNRSKAFDLIKGEVEKGRQAYIVFPLIEESEAMSAKAATIEYEELSKSVFKNYKVGLMHGELPPAEKENVMSDFVSKKVDILISTTVIEVGVDVPNATVMMIENAERFGLSQLHQLRGRIGRGGDQAYCLLVPNTYSEESSTRLKIMTETTNGFIISQEDLKIRGPGEFLGTKQSGLPDLSLADIVKDSKILEKARDKATLILSNDPEFRDHPELKRLLGEKENYLTAG